MSSTSTTPPRLHQINASYSPLEDRIQLNIALSDETEFRFLITRRMLPLLWEMLGKVVDSCSRARDNIDPLMRDGVAEMVQMNAVSNADFETKYQPGTRFPLGEEPILLSRLTLKADNPTMIELSLLPETGQGVTLTLDDHLTHVIANLLEQTASNTDWGISLLPLTKTLAASPSLSKHLH